MRMSRRAVITGGAGRAAALNTIWTYSIAQTGQTFTVPDNGLYDIEIHGGGGGGAGCYAYSDGTYGVGYSGGGGGGSGQMYTNTALSRGATYLITVGSGGTGGNSGAGSAGGISSFGTLFTLVGGGGGQTASSGGSASGALSSAGGGGSSQYMAWPPAGLGGQGNTTNMAQTYGDGSSGTTNYVNPATNGQPGAIIITLKSYT